MKILRPEVDACVLSGGSLQDMFDNVIKVLFNITDAEYDFIAETATDTELSIFLSALGTLETASTFTQRKLALILRNEMLVKFNNQSK